MTIKSSPTFKILSLGLLIMGLGRSAQAARVRCENLFVPTLDQVQNGAESLARFRSEIQAEKDTNRKRVLLEEFPHQLAQFVRQSPDEAQARQFFIDVLERLHAEEKERRLRNQTSEKTKKNQIQTERQNLDSWQGYAKIAAVFSEGIDRIILSPDGA